MFVDNCWSTWGPPCHEHLSTPKAFLPSRLFSEAPFRSSPCSQRLNSWSNFEKSAVFYGKYKLHHPFRGLDSESANLNLLLCFLLLLRYDRLFRVLFPKHKPCTDHSFAIVEVHLGFFIFSFFFMFSSKLGMLFLHLRIFEVQMYEIEWHNQQSSVPLCLAIILLPQAPKKNVAARFSPLVAFQQIDNL